MSFHKQCREFGAITTEAIESYNTRVSWWNNPTIRSILYQVLFIGIILFIGAWLINNAIVNLEERRIRSGFAFLGDEAGFDISESFISYSPTSTYGRAFLVGILNTIQIAVISIFFATILGTIIGVGRVSRNWIVAKTATIYVEIFRNIPVLLQLVAWYSFITILLPSSRQALSIGPNVYITKSGLFIPVLQSHPVYLWMIAALLAGLVLSGLIMFLQRRSMNRSHHTDQKKPLLRGWQLLGMNLGLPLLIWLIAGLPIAFDVPQPGRFNIKGGIIVSSEFLAMFMGLSLYTASFIAEVVRGGIEAVPKGQVEAADALGLRRGYVLRFIVLPQALRVIIPPLTSQYLNLTKNSSLGLAVAYPELVNVGNTAMNQNGQALECIAIYMTIYLILSLSTSAFMNWFNNRVALIER